MLPRCSPGLRAFLILVLTLFACLAQPLRAEGGNADFLKHLANGIEHRQQGNLTLSIEVLTALHARTENPRDKALAAGELGASLLQMRRLAEAEAPLKEAHEQFSGNERARYAIDLGNLAAARRQREAARDYFREAKKLADGDVALQAMAALNEARLLPAGESLPALAALAEQIRIVTPAEARARLALNLGNQARALGQPALQLAWEQLNEARQAAPQGSRLQLETLDALAQLYEDQKRDDDALKLTEQALAIAGSASATPTAIGDILIQLHWRQGRIAARQGRKELALAAYRSAVSTIESIRQDIPIEYEDNRSSFRDTLEPIYLGLADLLLDASEKLQGDARNAALKQVRSVVELIKQTEMQDYLGERCSVDSGPEAAEVRFPMDTAVLYPIILPGRVELLLETGAGMARKTTRVAADKLREVSQEFTRLLRSDPDAELPQARQLYDWLIRPLEADLAQQSIRTLVVVPDGVIRTLPLAALHDGKQYLIERMAVATSPGLTMIRLALGRHARETSLIAGLAQPGPVVEKLSSSLISSILQQPADATADAKAGSTTRSLRAADPSKPERKIVTRAISAESLKRHAKEALSLPGVKTEVETLSRQMRSKPMLDDAFTLSRFSSSVGSGQYDVVHIASHGIFGGSGDESFILAYDEVLTMNRLQQLLRSENLRKHPIRLLTLSACETAEGNERAPLGIAGAALKAKAETALGTLWPVEDNAATLIMNTFYDSLVKEKLGRAESLRRAQMAVLKKADYRHPFFWAPFIIVGNWN